MKLVYVVVVEFKDWRGKEVHGVFTSLAAAEARGAEICAYPGVMATYLTEAWELED